MVSGQNIEYNAFAQKIIAPFFRRKIKSVEGVEHLPQEKPYIFAVNHNVSFDHAILTAYLMHIVREIIYYPTKEGYYRFYKRLGVEKNLGMVCVDKKEPAGCLEVLYEKLTRGHIVGIFPEGKGHSNKELCKGKTGVARLALRAQIPVVPIGITGGEYGKRIIDWLYVFLDRRRNVHIKIGKPILFEDYYNEQITYQLLRNITDKIMHEISTLCGKTYMK